MADTFGNWDHSPRQQVREGMALLLHQTYLSARRDGRSTAEAQQATAGELENIVDMVTREAKLVGWLPE